MRSCERFIELLWFELSLCISIHCDQATMTFQIPDTIFYRGGGYTLGDEPLAQYWRLPNFISLGSDNHRGYTAVWAIVGDGLFLVSLSGAVDGGNQNGLELVFPEAREPVHAHWYSGGLRLLSGRVVDNSEFAMLFEHETILEVQQGRVKGSRFISREYSSARLIDPLFLQSVDLFEEFGASVLGKLKSRNIHRIGDLVRFGEIELMKAAKLDVDTVIEIKEILASRGLILGFRIDGWPPENHPPLRSDR